MSQPMVPPQKLYRYCSIPQRDLATLKGGHVYYVSAPQLNDPFDCQAVIDSSDISDLEMPAIALDLMQRAMQQYGKKYDFDGMKTHR